MLKSPDGSRPQRHLWRPETADPQWVGLRAWFPLEDNAHTQWEAVTGRTLLYSGSGGSSMGPATVNSTMRLMTGFDGANSALDVNGAPTGTNSYYDISGSFTISMWVFIHSAGVGTDRGLVNHRTTAGGESGDYATAVLSSNVFSVAFYSAGFRVQNGTTALAANKLYHVAGVWDQTATVLTAYVNGQAEGNTTFAGRSLVGAARPLHIGYNHLAVVPQLRFTGGISDVRLYTRALTSREVWALYDPATRWDLYDTPRPRIVSPGVLLPTFDKGQAQPTVRSPLRVVSYGSHVR